MIDISALTPTGMTQMVFLLLVFASLITSFMTAAFGIGGGGNDSAAKTAYAAASSTRVGVPGTVVGVCAIDGEAWPDPDIAASGVAEAQHDVGWSQSQ